MPEEIFGAFLDRYKIKFQYQHFLGNKVISKSEGTCNITSSLVFMPALIVQVCH